MPMFANVQGEALEELKLDMLKKIKRAVDEMGSAPSTDFIRLYFEKTGKISRFRGHIGDNNAIPREEPLCTIWGRSDCVDKTMLVAALFEDAKNELLWRNGM